jgi:predicted Ser/Thr protein kinase
MEQIGRYRIIGELGRGAMGVVFHAIDPNIGRPVAIKTIRLEEFATAEDRERLRDRLYREARSAGMLSHPNIVTVYDVEEAGEVAYIAMEFVNGPTLESVLSSRQPVAPARLLGILREAASGLDFAHRKGIVHRDIKPANIMIAEDGVVKITDFGIAKLSKSEQLTQTGAILGTPNYMSPEQVQGVVVDGRSDQFSLGVIAYEMLTGEKPFAGEHLTTTVYRIVHDEPAGADRVNPTLNSKIDGVVRKALAKKPDARYASCSAFISALEAACATAKGWTPALRGRGAAMPTADLPRAELMATAAEIRPNRRRRGAWYAAAILVGVALGASGWMAWDQDWFGAAPEAQPAAGQTEPARQPQAPAQRSAPLEAVKPPGTATETAKTVVPPAVEPQKPAAVTPPEPPARKAAPPAPGVKTREIAVNTAPQGARVVLDNRAETACTTPCTLTAAYGRHVFSISLEGFQQIQREVDIGEEPFEMSPVTLRATSGTLVLISNPPGASIYVNGQKLPDTTPARLRLAPGKYNVAVEKDGVRRSEDVVMDTGIRRLQVTLE